MKKITKATFKSFLRKNEGNIYISVGSRFDGMQDMCVTQEGGFQKAELNNDTCDNQCGYTDIWLVGNSRDSFTAYDDGHFQGIEVYNCCGAFIVATPKQEQTA